MSVAQGRINCTDDCDFDLPATEFASCNPETNLSQIAKIYIAKQSAASFSDWTQAGEWATRLSNSATGADSIRPVTVVGDKPAPTVTEKTISGNRIVPTEKKHVINFEIDESNATNHEFARGAKCMKQVKMWYETIGGLLFGGNDGIDVTIGVDMALSRTAGDIVLYPGTLKWDSFDLEERCVSPIAQ